MEKEVMEKEIVTKEEAQERINENYEVIDTAYGRIKASKRWFAVCGTIGAIAAGIGVAGIATVGFVLVPVATTGLGVAAAVVSAKFYNDETKEIEYIPNSQPEDEATDVELWKIYNDEDDLAEQKYSIYWNKTEAFPTNVVLTVEFDAGLNNVETTLTFKGTGTVIIRTNSNYNLVIDAPEATVNHYGEGKTVEVNQVSANTYNVYAKVDFIQVEDGQHVVLKEGSEVNAVYAKGTNNVEVLNGQEEAIYDVTDGSLEDVMAGATMFAGGLGTAEKPFTGTFDGGNHKISNLKPSFLAYLFKRGGNITHLKANWRYQSL